MRGLQGLSSESSVADANSVQRVPEPDPLPDIFLNTRPDPIQFWKLSGSGNPKYRVLPDISGKPEELPEIPGNTRE